MVGGQYKITITRIAALALRRIDGCVFVDEQIGSPRWWVPDFRLCTLVGIGAIVMPQRHIGSWSVVSAGALVHHHVAALLLWSAYRLERLSEMLNMRALA